MSINLNKVMKKKENRKVHFDENTWIEMEYNDIQYIISKSIKEYRNEHNLTQEELAKKLGVKQPMVVKIESSIFNPSIKFLVKLWNKLSNEDENFGKILLEKISERVDNNYYTSLKIKGTCQVILQEDIECNRENTEVKLSKQIIKTIRDKEITENLELAKAS